ncbi:MAG: ChaN family lipoprotein [Campylobacter sp.]|nr:ChaN family lipoprotein [Campylobacter sp.]
MLKSILKLSFTMIFLLLITGCIEPGSAVLEPKDFRIIEAKSKKALSYDEFVERILHFDLILLGEEHDSRLQHLAQEKLIVSLSQTTQIAVAFEMIASNLQTTIDTVQKNRDMIAPSEIRSKILWDKKWKWNDYEPVVRAAFYNAKIFGANLSQNEIATIFTGAEPIIGYVSTTQTVRNRIKEAIKMSHDLKSDDNIEPFVQAQQYKDRRMADILQHSLLPTILIAGNFHVDKTMGVPLHLIDFQSKKSVVAVGFLSIENETVFDEKNFDYFWIFSK